MSLEPNLVCFHAASLLLLLVERLLPARKRQTVCLLRDRIIEP
jgi:hypothetical protein